MRRSQRPLVVARRWDQLGGRLSAIINARSLAELLHLEFRFVWPRGLDPAVNEPRQIFDQAFLDEFEIQPAELEHRRVVQHSTLTGSSDTADRWTVVAAGADVFVDVNEIFEVVQGRDEGRQEAAERFRRCFSEIGWSEEVRRLTAFCSQWGREHSIAAVHVRAGDIVTGAWRHGLVHEKYVPTPYIQHAIDQLTAGAEQVVVVSDNPAYLTWLRQRFPRVTSVAEIVPGYVGLTEVQQAFADILILSACEPIVGPPSSAFSLLAATLGRRPLIRTDSLVPEGRERDVLRRGIAASAEHAAGSRLWAGLRARDICWYLDVFGDTTSLQHQQELARAAVECDPGFIGALTRFARLATLAGDLLGARSAATRALRIAEPVRRNDDPLMEALATDVAVACFAVVREPSRWTRWPLARRGRGAQQRLECELEEARNQLNRCRELYPFWIVRDEVFEDLAFLITTAELLSRETPAVRRRVSRGLARFRLGAVAMQRARADGLAQHRSQTLFDSLTRDLDRMALHLYDAACRAELLIDGPRPQSRRVASRST